MERNALMLRGVGGWFRGGVCGCLARKVYHKLRRCSSLRACRSGLRQTPCSPSCLSSLDSLNALKSVLVAQTRRLLGFTRSGTSSAAYKNQAVRQRHP